MEGLIEGRKRRGRSRLEGQLRRDNREEGQHLVQRCKGYISSIKALVRPWSHKEILLAQSRKNSVQDRKVSVS